MITSIFIETERLNLRQWRSSDHEPYIAMNLDKEVMEFFPAQLSAEESTAHIKRISNYIEEKGYGLFAVERKDTNKFIGFTGFSHPKFEAYFTPCTEIGWRIAKEHWNLGFATEAAKACLAFGFRNLKLEKIYSFTSIHNKRSEQVMIRIGMEKMGEFEHPLLEQDHYLQKHVLYKTNPYISAKPLLRTVSAVGKVSK